MSDQTVPDTEPPTANHGWLEQFKYFGADIIGELEAVVKAGIEPTERVILLEVALKLFDLAMSGANENDFNAEQKQKIESTIIELELYSL